MENLITGLAAAFVCLQGIGAFAAQNLIVNGDFSNEALFARECRSSGSPTVGLSLFSEDLTWNKCGKLEVVATEKSKVGSDVVNANAWIGQRKDSDLPGFAVRPNATYEFSIDLRGTPRRVRVAARTFSTDDNWKGAETRLTTVSMTDIGTSWQTYRGTFKTGPADTRCALCVQMWSDTQYPKAIQYKVGDWVMFDNVSVRDRQGDIAAFAAKVKKPFVVASVPVTADMRLPFVPEEIYSPPDAIRLRAAVNEHKALPLALANLTGELAEYRVSLETENPTYGVNRYDGDFGLERFPQKQIAARKAVRFKDRDPYPGKLRLDPLVKMDEGMTVTVPAKEAGLVWFDFDTTDVPPGLYKGRLRVIPLSEPAEIVKVKDPVNYIELACRGKMQTIPVTLEVLPIILDREPSVPGDLSGGAVDRAIFEQTVSYGGRYILLSPWAFKFPLLPDGNLSRECEPQWWEDGDLAKKIPELIRWAAELHTYVRFSVKYSTYTTFRSMYNIGDDKALEERLWKQWNQRIDAFMTNQGLSHDEWRVQMWDEPRFENKDALVRALRLAHEAAPEMRILVTLLGGDKPLGVKELRELEPYVTDYTFHDLVYLRNPGFHDYIAELVKKGKHVSHYTCSTLMTEDLDREFRQNAWMSERYGLAEQGLYHIIDARGGAGATNWKVTQAGGLVYRSYHHAIPSIRAMAYRQGVEDVKYIALLKKLGSDDPEVREFLATAAKTVTENPAGGDRYLADRIRDRAAELILRIQGKQRLRK